MKEKKVIVISAVNLTEGGTYTILLKTLDAISKINKYNEYRVIVLVNNHNNLDYDNIEFIDLPKAKKNWLYRLYYEYWGFKKMSKQLNPYLWLSLHDITPNVIAERRGVYCHNPTPFSHFTISDIKFDFKVMLFALFYRYLYKINIKRNDYVIVQQDWIRDKFANFYNLDKNKIIVAYPCEMNHIQITIPEISNNSETIFFFPSLPRFFKNFEVICEAAMILQKKGIRNFKVVITIKGNENKYAKWLYSKYKNVGNIIFEGLIPHNKMADYYEMCHCLIFPSKLETWGLPISEFVKYHKPMLLADLPYAHETSTGAMLVDYFDNLSVASLSEKMYNVIMNDYTSFQKSEIRPINDPKCFDFSSLIKMILDK